MAGKNRLSICVQDPAAKRRHQSAIPGRLDDFTRKDTILLELFDNLFHWLGKLTLQKGMEMLANDFLPSPAVQSLRALVPERDFVIQVAHDDGIVTEIEQPRFFGELLLRLLAFGDIANIALDDCGFA